MPRALVTAAALLLAGPAMAHPPSASSDHHHEADGPVAAAPAPVAPAASVASAPRVAADALPAGSVTIEIVDDVRIITSNGIPDHAPGTFPRRGNPNRISAQSHRYQVPLRPKVAERPTPMRGPFGVALNGVPFDPGTAEVWTPEGRRQHDRSSRWNYDALSGRINLGIDEHSAHVQPTGSYHYHGTPTGLVAARRAAAGDTGPDTEPPARMVQVGWAADGFPIYTAWGHADPADATSPLIRLRSSYRLRTEDRAGGTEGPGGTPDGTFVQDWIHIAGAGDLDECNGRVGVTPEFPAGTYHYVLTETYPFVPRLFRGTPDASFLRGPGGPGRPGIGPGRGAGAGPGNPPRRRRGPGLGRGPRGAGPAQRSSPTRPPAGPGGGD